MIGLDPVCADCGRSGPVEWGSCADCRAMIASGHTIHVTRSGKRVARKAQPCDLIIVKVGSEGRVHVRAPLGVLDWEADKLAADHGGTVDTIHRGKPTPTA